MTDERTQDTAQKDENSESAEAESPDSTDFDILSEDDGPGFDESKTESILSSVQEQIRACEYDAALEMLNESIKTASAAMIPCPVGT